MVTWRSYVVYRRAIRILFVDLLFISDSWRDQGLIDIIENLLKCLNDGWLQQKFRRLFSNLSQILN